MADCGSCSIQDKINYCCRKYRGYGARSQSRQHVIVVNGKPYFACVYLTDEGKCHIYPTKESPTDTRPSICGIHKCTKKEGIEGKVSESQ